MAGPVPAASPLRLVGRERELAQLQECWDQAIAGQAGFVLVTGEAGVGKSRLLDELSSLVQRAGSDAMRARCFAARGRLALASVSEWLRSPPLRLARERLEPVWAREVDRLVPSAGADPWPCRARWLTPGNATGSWKACPGQYCQLAGLPVPRPWQRNASRSSGRTLQPFSSQ